METNLHTEERAPGQGTKGLVGESLRQRRVMALAMLVIVCIASSACSGLSVSSSREPSGIRQENERSSIGTTTTTSAAGPLRLNDVETHRNGVELEIKTIEFGANGTWVEFEVTNPRSTGIRINGCCRGTYLVDDRGATYPLQPPQGDPTMLIDGESSVSGTLFFEGKVSSNADSIELLFGDTDNGSQTDPDAAWPKFIFGPYFIERG